MNPLLHESDVAELVVGGAAVRLDGVAHLAEGVLEAARSVDVQEAHGARIALPERVHHAGRRGDEGSRSAADRLAIDVEVELSLEDVEAVGRVGVGVRLGPLVGTLDRVLEDRDLRKRGLDERHTPPRLVPELLTLAGPAHDASRHAGIL